MPERDKRRRSTLLPTIAGAGGVVLLLVAIGAWVVFGDDGAKLPRLASAQNGTGRASDPEEGAALAIAPLAVIPAVHAERVDAAERTEEVEGAFAAANATPVATREIRGIVVDDLGTPLAEARVELLLESRSLDEQGARQQARAVDGRFGFSEIPTDATGTVQAFSSALGRKSSAVAIGAKTSAETEEEPLMVVISRAGGLVGAIVLSDAVRHDHFFVSLQRDSVDPMSVADPARYESDSDGHMIPVVSVPTKDAKLAADGSFRFAPLDPGRHRLTIGFSVAASSVPLITFEDVLVLPGDDSRDSRFAAFDPRGWLRTVVIELVAADGDSVSGGIYGVTESPAVSGAALAKALRDQAARLAARVAAETQENDDSPPRTARDALLARARAAAMSITVASEWGTPFIGARFELALPVTDDFGVAVQVPGFRLARDFALGDFVRITLERPLRVTFRLDPELEELAELAPVQLQWTAIDADVLPPSNVVELPQLDHGVATVEFAATGSWGVRACMRESRGAAHSSWIDLEPLVLAESSDGSTIELRRVR